MTLDSTETAMSPDDLIRHGEELALSKLLEVAEREAKTDCRAFRQLKRLMEGCGYGVGLKPDDGA